jgi:hypothetical protein
MDRTTEKMCSRKWCLCWKINVQCVREINFFHSDVTVIMLLSETCCIQLETLLINHPL